MDLDAARGRVVLRLFQRFVARGEERRREALDALRGRDPELGAEVSSLLRHFDRAQEVAFLAEPLSTPDPPSTEADRSEDGPSWPSPSSTEPGGDRDDLAPGVRVGRYVVEGVVGRGGMGVVYRARRVEDYHQAAAVKLMSRSLTPTAIRRFHLERQILALMKHPNIVRLLDGGEAAGGRPFLVMDFIEGESLTKYAREIRPSPRDSAALLTSVVAAVAYAHESDVVHRDLKPSNILMTRDRVPVPMVTDFGLARMVDDEAWESLTGAEGMVGTPGYMAPEQILGGEGRRSPAVDVYALGAVLYFLLTGRPPYDAPTPFETCKLALDREPEPIGRIRPGVPRDLTTIVAAAMARDPARRYPSARAMGEDLRRFLAGEPITARPPSRLGRLGRRLAKHRRLVAAAVVATAVALIGTLIGLSRWNRDLGRKNEGLIRLAAAYSDTMERLARDGGLAAPEFHDDVARFAKAIDEIRRSEGDEAVLVDVRYRAALAHFQLARSHQVRHSREPAVAWYESSIDALRDLARDHPERRDIRYDLFRGLFCFGDFINQDDRARAIALHRESLDMIAALVRDEPTNLDYLEAESAQRVNLGNRLAACRSEEWERHFQRAIAIGEEVCRRPDGKPRYRRALARALEALASWRHEAGILDEDSVRCSLEAGAALLRDLPDVPDYRDEQAARLRLLALIRADLGEPREAESLLNEAVAMQESAVARSPRVGEHVQRLANILRLRAEARLALGLIGPARADFAAADARLNEFLGDRDDAGAVADRLHLAARAGPIDPAEAERILDETPEDPPSLDARTLRVRALSARGRHAEALRLATADAPPEHRGSPALELLAATAEARLGLRDEARARLAAAGRSSPHVPQECLFLARLRREAIEAGAD